MAAAFRRWSAIPDTVFTEEELAAANDALTEPIRLSDPAPVNEIKPADSILQMGARGPFVRLAQTRLKVHDYHLGAIDGQFGSATRGAVLKFQADNRLITDGVIGRLTWNALLEQVSTAGKASGRAHATADDVQAKGSSTIKQADNAQTIGVLVTGLGGIGVLNTFSEEIAATSGAVNTAMEAVKPTLATISDNCMIGAALFGLAVVFFGGRVIR
ncbi:MAG: peptidoglycan-binding domain-containing protein, partial [Pseudomonadota bacterium]